MIVSRLAGVAAGIPWVATRSRGFLTCLVCLSTVCLGAPGLGAQTAPPTPVNSTSAAQVVTVSIGSNFTLGKIAVLTEGVANLDFRFIGGGTCTVGASYTSGQTCTVRYTFTPQHPGTRNGAVVLYNNASPAQQGAIAYLQGTGNGPQLVFSSNTAATVLTKNVSSPADVVVDGAGNVFVVDYGDDTVKEIVAAGGYATVKTLAAGYSFYSPEGLAIDGADNVFVADTGTSTVKEILAAGGYTTVTTLASGYSFSLPFGVAVDGAGNVFVADTDNNAVEEILAAGGYTTVNTLGGGFVFNFPSDVVVDGSGNVFVADSGNNAVEEIPAAGGYSSVNAVGSGFDGPDGVAIDGVGNVFVADTNNKAIKEILAAGGYTTVNTVGGEFDYPPGVAVDGVGDVFVADTNNNAVDKLDLSDPPSLNFASTDPETTSSDSPQTVIVANDGNLALTLSALTYPADFPEAPGVLTDCTSSTALDSDATCTLSVDFTPLSGGTLSESIGLTDNSLYANSGATQSVSVTGNGLGAVQKLVFGTLPSSLVVVGGNAGSAITVEEEDTYGNLVTPAADSITLTVTYPDTTMQTYTVTASGGLATFDLSGAALTESGTYTYTASAPGLTGVTEATASESVLGSTLGVTTPAQTVTVQLNSNFTLGSISVVTQGASNLDFQAATGGTCTPGTAYTAGETCTVAYTFTPHHPGPRYGAVVLYNNAATPKAVAMAYLQGTGNGPQLLFSNNTPMVLGKAFHNPNGVAVDGAGNVFVADTANNEVKEILAASGYTTVKRLSGAYSEPAGVAVDGAGNVFVADTNDGVVKEILAASGYKTVETLGSGFSSPVAVAVDGSGNVFVIDNQFVKEIVAAAGYSTVNTLGGSFAFTEPVGLAVDGSDNIFVVDYSSGALDEITVASDYSTVNTLETGLDGPAGLAVDGSGNLFFTQTGMSSVYELLAEGGYSTTETLGSGFSNPGGVAVDSAGNVFIADYGNSAVKELNLGSPSSLIFARTLPGQTSVDSPKTVTITNGGNQNLNFSAVNYPQDFPEPAESGDCNGSTSLGPEASCTLTIDFSPLVSSVTSGITVLNESIGLTDNGLGGSQSISLEGNEATLFGALNAPLDAVTSSSTITSGDGVLFAGWAIDVNDGAPVSRVAILIDGTPVGNATLGVARSGVANEYGSRYLHAGWTYNYTGSLAAGAHKLIVVLYDSEGLTTQLGPRNFTVTP